MPKHGKKYREARSKVEDRLYDLEAAVNLAKTASFTRFDETLEVALFLGVDPRHADQMVRGTVILPHGIGKTKRVLVFATGEKVKEAESAGADYIGGKELAEKIQGGWMDFDAVVATPDMMKDVGRLGKVLGPRGLMPNPKAGTVVPADELARAIEESKAGRVEFRLDKTANVHVSIGKTSFEVEQLFANFAALMAAIRKARPAAAKGAYIRKIVITSTMGPGVKVDVAQALAMD